MPRNQNPRKNPRTSETTTPDSGGSGTKRRPNPRISPEARAEVVLLQSLALRLGQEAARQNDIPVKPYLPLDGDPRGAALSHLEGYEGTDQPVTLRATLTVQVNPRTGAIISFTPPPRPRRP